MIEIDIWETVDHLMKRHGKAAAATAADEIKYFERVGDHEGVATWVEIKLTIEKLIQEKRGTSEPGN